MACGCYVQVWSFRCQAAVDGSLRPEAGALLSNVHAYYSQYLQAVKTRVAEGLAPVEKQLLVMPRCPALLSQLSVLACVTQELYL
jgi:hypothetical protein